MNQQRIEKLTAEWERRRNNGEGFGIGKAEDTPEQAAVNDGLEVVHKSTDGFVLACDEVGDVVGIGDVWGPWAILLHEKAG